MSQPVSVAHAFESEKAPLPSMGAAHAKENAAPPLLELRSISKSFPGVRALDHVSLTVQAGEIHALIGENGAGKSTLIKSILGIEIPESGEIFWQGKPLNPSLVAHHDAAPKIAAIHQELSNIGCLSVTENFFLGIEQTIPQMPLIVDHARQRALCLEALQLVGATFSPDALVETLGTGEQQLLEIARAIRQNARLIIMDEPSSALSRKEIDHLLHLMLRLKSQGIAILFITHKLDEAKAVCDVVSVLKDGKSVCHSLPMGDVDEDRMITMMVGRKLEDKYPKRANTVQSEVMFRANHLTNHAVHDVSFEVKRGELVGFFGLIGAHRTETVRAIFGADPLLSGSITVDGKTFAPKSPQDAISAGVVLATENRKEEGLILFHDVIENTTLPTLQNYEAKSHHLLDGERRHDDTLRAVSTVHLRPANIHSFAGKFSGGNQQKIVISKWLLSNAKVFIFDEPTKGVDVGAKIEIYTIINQLLERGLAVIMVSSEMLEVLGMADRIFAMRHGQITGEFLNSSDPLVRQALQEKIMLAATEGPLK